MENKDYGEIFCQAVDEIVSQRLENIKFDSTILCTVVDDSQRNSGKYIVTNNGGITKFEAFSEKADYRNNNNVYVQIPNGDWDQQKIIIGKKTDKVDEPYIYKKPFSSLVDITGNLITGKIDRKLTGLIANKGITQTEDGKVNINQSLEEHVIDLWTYNISDSNAICKEEGMIQSGYTRLGIQADFQSWLNTFYTNIKDNDNINSIPRSITQGKYGLRLTIIPKRESVVSVNSDEQELKAAKYILELNSDDMNGNPYNFASFYTQQKLFDISSIGEIEQMKLQFYEITGSFIDNEDYYISDIDFLGNSIAPNLYVNDVYISLGYDANNFDTETVQIYTLDPTTYSRTADPLTNNHKRLQLRWVHKTDDGTYKSITAEDNIGKYEIRWYRYQLGAASADEYCGVYWKLLSIQTLDDNEIKDPDWKTYNDNSEIEDFRYPGFFYSWALPDITLQQEQYKAIVIYNENVYRSNIITFQNKDEVVSAPTVDAVQALSINCEDGSYGNYRIYNNGNSLLDFSQGAVKRQWKVYFKSVLEKIDGENNPDCELIEAEQIEWIIPLTKTMIVLDDLPNKDEFDENNNPFYSYDYDASGQKIRIHIFKYDNIPDNNTLTYRIRGYYSQTYSDNTIQCKVIKNKITYTATKEMTFGIAGTTGTDCTFILDFNNGVTAVTDKSDSAVIITARLYDYENNEVNISEKNIKWSWKVNQSLFDINNEGLKKYQIEVKRNKNKIPENKANYAILQAELIDWGDFSLKAYLPIPLKSKTSYDYISGATQIIYNSNGEITDYFKNPYILYENAKVVSDVSWKIINGVNGEENYTPKITTNKAGEQYLTPLSFFVDDACEYICIVGSTQNGDYWSQPILIMINKYPSAMINQWDGRLKIDEKNGYILSPRLVAGKKESNNSFSGVMLGDFGSDQNIEPSLASGDTGLYGYDHGEQTYAFKQDGTAFIGKSGVGRIEFDGSSGRISSAGYKLDGSQKNGMLIDLKNNLIDAQKKGTSVFKLSQNEPYFQINNLNSQTLMQVGDSSYYLQSSNYDEETNKGTHLDLHNGNFITNSGTFNGDIWIYYGNRKLNWATGSNNKTTLNSILDQINSNIESLQTQLEITNQIQDNLSVAVNQSSAAISDLNHYFGLGVGDQGQRTITMNSHWGAFVMVGNNITLKCTNAINVRYGDTAYELKDFILGVTKGTIS